MRKEQEAVNPQQKTSRVYGIHAVKTLVRYDSALIVAAWMDHARGDAVFTDLIRLLEKKGVRVERVERARLDELSGNAVHQGIVVQTAEAATDTVRDEAALGTWLDEQQHPLLVLVLDGVQDPHNLGACLRSAAAADCDAVIIPKDRASGLTPVVHKVACGATQMVPLFQVTNLARVLDRLRASGVWIVGAEGESTTTLYQVDLRGSIAIVMGAEGSGLRRLTRDKCDYLAAIPMAKQMESLNVSVAAGVFLFEAVRQRQAQ